MHEDMLVLKRHFPIKLEINFFNENRHKYI